jgi:hypothetical protein
MRQILSLALVISFIITNHFNLTDLTAFAATAAYPNIPEADNPALGAQLDITRVQVSAEIGKIQEVYEAKGQGAGDRGQETRVKRQGTRDKRRETRDKRQEMGKQSCPSSPVLCPFSDFDSGCACDS